MREGSVQFPLGIVEAEGCEIYSSHNSESLLRWGWDWGWGLLTVRK